MAIEVIIERPFLFEKQLRLFKKLVEKEGIFDDLARNQYYFKPSEKRQKKHMRANFGR